MCFVSASMSLYNMFHGNAQSIAAFLRNLLTILMEICRTIFYLKSSFDKSKIHFWPEYLRV